jgi:hypothetical protein
MNGLRRNEDDRQGQFGQLRRTRPNQFIIVNFKFNAVLLNIK